jgi:hypothetical protein
MPVVSDELDAGIKKAVQKQLAPGRKASPRRKLIYGAVATFGLMAFGLGHKVGGPGPSYMLTRDVEVPAEFYDDTVPKGGELVWIKFKKGDKFTLDHKEGDDCIMRSQRENKVGDYPTLKLAARFKCADVLPI